MQTENLRIEFTDKEITPWGGMAMLKNMLDRMDFRRVLYQCKRLPIPMSNRGYYPHEIIEPFLVSVWCGANRFLHTEITRQDNPLIRIFNLEKAPGNDTYKRFFRKFNQATNQEVFDHLYSWFFSQLKFDNFTLDCDSSILTRYGNQEGASKGYNPHKPGRNSHHPIMAFVADCNMVANFWLRSGNANSANNFVSFLEDTLQKLKGKKLGLIRLDSGFYDRKVFEFLEERSHSYIVAARFYKPIQLAIKDTKTWLKIEDGIEVSETTYQSPEWKESRRMVMIRQQISKRPKATGRQLKLFAEEGIIKQYRYSCFITNLTLPAPEVWRLYRNRATAENKIKDLKYDFGFDSFNLNSFWGTEAALGFVMIAYNLMSLFRQLIINSEVQTKLSTLRFEMFAIGAYLVRDGRQIILKLSLPLKRRQWFTGLWEESRTFKPPDGVSIA